MKAKLLSIAFALAGASTVIGLSTGIAVIANKQKTQVTKEEKLAQYELIVSNNFKKNMLKRLASEFATQPLARISSVPTLWNNEKWSKEIFYKTQITKQEFESDNNYNHDFLLVNKNTGALFNVERSSFQSITFKSFANDLTGTLYLQVTLENKDEKDQTKNEQIIHVYELSGFATINQINKYDQFIDVEVTKIKDKDAFKKEFTRFSEFYAAYSSLGVSERPAFIQKWFTLPSNNLVEYDLSNATLTTETNEQNQDIIKLVIPYKIKVLAAENKPDQLNKIDLYSPNDQELVSSNTIVINFY
ncbi:hypothetical protein H9M94_01150 [Mycoplasma sp. Pen4]|uniref:MAG1430 family protein n=1 Tax=Mycoplasma sp. Pen4 TaxID=640330 RepID=UPI00165445A1|nr:hypothetical protein [Mycoplasma sp. Pen4]QNM93866.1 hypothetical protein H9M94_01150 [Mycoplasma sp. Pen4]